MKQSCKLMHHFYQSVKRNSPQKNSVWNVKTQYCDFEGRFVKSLILNDVFVEHVMKRVVRDC